MNANLVKFITKAKPIVTKAAPVILAATFSAIQELSAQKSAMHVDDLEKRIRDLEALFKK